MKDTSHTLFSARAFMIMALFMYTATDANASNCFRDFDNGINFGNGACDPGETASECADLGKFVLEICPPVDEPNKQFPIPSTCGDLGASCSEWSYVVTKVDRGHYYRNDNDGKKGKANFLLPTAVEILEGEGKIFAPGVGDPKTGLGRFDLSNFVFKVGFEFSSSKNTAYISYKTNPAAPEETPILLKPGKKKSGLIQGPGDLPIEEITRTMDTVTTRDGVSLTVETDIAGNVVSATAENANGDEVPVQVIPEDQVFLCLPTVPNPDLNFPNPNEHECDRIIFVPDRTTIRAGEESLCVYRYRGRYYRIC